jgi:hypothetical protein
MQLEDSHLFTQSSDVVGGTLAMAVDIFEETNIWLYY